MENKDIILFILTICVLYLLYCNTNKEKFTGQSSSSTGASSSSTGASSSSTPVTTSSPPDLTEQIIRNRVDSYLGSRPNVTVSESIKNVGLLANRIINADGDFTFPANLNVTGRLNLLPEGTIVMWGRANIPNGWVRCDGTRGTPDLRGRFVLGEGNGTGLTNRTLNDTGPTDGTPGANDTGVRNGGETHYLTENQMPSHHHNIHNNDRIGPVFTMCHHCGDRNVDGGGWEDQPTDTDNRGNGEEHNNMPPYHVLIYIMKVYD